MIRAKSTSTRSPGGDGVAAAVVLFGLVLLAQDVKGAMPAGDRVSLLAGEPQSDRTFNPGTQDSLAAVQLTGAERKQIIDQVEQTSFDIPESWDAELRVRRVSIGEAEGLVLRGTNLLCGGTGNCQTWIFRRSQGQWLNLFEQQAPVVSGLRFEEQATAGIMNLLVSANSSAEKESRILFKFDGKFYRQSECFDASIDAAGAEKVEEIPCT